MNLYFFFGSLFFIISVYVFLHIILLDYGIFESRLRKRIKKIYTRNTYGYLNFITSSELKKLVNFIDKNKKHLKVRANQNELFVTIEDIPNFPDKLIKKLRDRIVEIEGIKKHHTDIIHEDVISYMTQGGYHDYHKDMNFVNWVLVRYNIILEKPQLGGLSVYGDELNDWPVASIWKCVAGSIEHGVTKIESTDRRVVLCLGFMIKYPDVIEKQHNQSIKIFETLPKELSYLTPQ